MNTLVCIKQVPFDEVEVHLDAATQKPATAAIEKITNAFDTYAVEMAVRDVEANGGSVTVASIGDESVKNNLKNLIAVGAGKAYLFHDDQEDNDENAVAAKLAQVVKKCEAENGAAFDVILLGKESTDEISGQVAAILAEKMGLPFVSSVVAVEAKDGGLSVKQETEEGFAFYQVSAPAVLSVAKPAYDPRYPNIKSKMAARKAVIPAFDGELAAVEPIVKVIGYSEPAKRTAGVKIQEKVAEDAVIKAMALMTQDKVL